MLSGQLQGLVLLLALLFSPPLRATEPDPATTVETFHEALLQVMKTPGMAPREQLLNPVVAAGFDVLTIARISLGRAWRGMEVEDQGRMVDRLQALITSTYASRFGAFDGQVFETLDVAAVDDNRARVRTRLVTPGETASLDYMLIRTPSGWRIYDIVANGVSDLALKRSSYAALHDQGGLSAVLKDIQASIDRNRAPAES